MDFKDYYKVLGLAPSATAEEIKRTYKKLARKYHPDVSEEANAQQKFQEVSEAYEVLKDADKRAEYDELYQYVNNPGQFRRGGGQHFKFDSNFSAEAGFEDLLRSIFGERGGFGGFESRGGFDPRGFAARGRDIHHKLHVTLEEAYAGGARQLRLGTMNGERAINVKIPAGVTRGQELRLKGQGEAGSSKETAGDLYLEIDFSHHPLFEVDGKDVILVLPITPWEAALGDNVEVPTLGGKVNLKIPPNSQNGGKLRLKGRGLAGGDQIVVLKVVMPKVETDQQKAAFETMKRDFRFDPREHLGR